MGSRTLAVLVSFSRGSAVVWLLCVVLLLPLLMSPLTFSRVEEISWEEFAELLISSLASSHVLYNLSAACLACLVAMSIASAACSVESRRGPICLITAWAISSAFVLLLLVLGG